MSESPLRAAVAIALLLALAARADPPDGEVQLELARRPERTFLFNDPARLPAPASASVFTRLTYSGGESPTRPFASNLSTRGALVELGGEIGLTRSLSLTAAGAQGELGTGASASGAVLGLRWSALPSSRPTSLVVSGGYLRELSGHDGLWARVALGHDEGRARLALALHGERVLADGRDKLDVMVTAGATFRLAGSLRAGVEYVGQDLEESIAPEAEHGARHIVGPVASFGLFDEQLALVAGPAVMLGAGPARALGRLALACSF